jgi:hypothetical protein
MGTYERVFGIFSIESRERPSGIESPRGGLPDQGATTCGTRSTVIALWLTAAARGHELTVGCPACREAFAIDRDRLGTETTCPRPACGTRLRINPFVLRPLPRRS